MGGVRPKCQGKSPDQPPRPPFGPPVVRVAARTSRLASREARKSLLFTPVRESSGECRVKRGKGKLESLDLAVGPSELSPTVPSPRGGIAPVALPGAAVVRRACPTAIAEVSETHSFRRRRQYSRGGGNRHSSADNGGEDWIHRAHLPPVLCAQPIGREKAALSSRRRHQYVHPLRFLSGRP